MSVKDKTIPTPGVESVSHSRSFCFTLLALQRSTSPPAATAAPPCRELDVDDVRPREGRPFETLEAVSVPSPLPSGKRLRPSRLKYSTGGSIEGSADRSRSPTLLSEDEDLDALVPHGGVDTFLPHLCLGDVGSDRDMILEEFDQAAMSCLLKRHDFAFVLRSDGASWTYAIVAEASQKRILFVVDEEGSTKGVPRRLWPTRVRLANAGASVAASLASPSPGRHLAESYFVRSLPKPTLHRLGSE